MNLAVPRERLYYVDWLRIIAFALLVLYHVGMVYVPWDYHVKSTPTFEALEPFMRLTNPWRMSLLFVISGLATGLMLGRDGLARVRSKRLLWPLLFGMAVIVPPQSYFQVQQKLGYDGTYLEFLRLYFVGYHGFCDAKGCLQLPTWNHLWFLPYLACYTLLLLAAWRWLPRRKLSALADALGGLDGWRLLAWPIVTVGLLRALLLPRFGETHALLGDWWAHATYGSMFLGGVLLARRPVLLARLEAQRWLALGFAALAWLALMSYADVARSIEVPELFRLPMRFVFATMQWTAIVAAFGFARRHLDVDHRWRAPLTEGVFPLYLVHQTFIVVGFVALRRLGLPIGAEALLLVAVTYLGGFACWQAARHIAWLRPWMGMSAWAPARYSEVPANA
jgi:glucan biosynthesis protein C